MWPSGTSISSASSSDVGSRPNSCANWRLACPSSSPRAPSSGTLVPEGLEVHLKDGRLDVSARRMPLNSAFDLKDLQFDTTLDDEDRAARLGDAEVSWATITACTLGRPLTHAQTSPGARERKKMASAVAPRRRAA